MRSLNDGSPGLASNRSTAKPLSPLPRHLHQVRTDASVPIRLLIPTPRQRVIRISAETDDLAKSGSARPAQEGAALLGSGTVGSTVVNSGGFLVPGPVGTPGTMTVAGNLAV